jgi:hypothetical protein
MPKYIYCIANEEAQLDVGHLKGLDDNQAECIHSNGLTCVVSEIEAATREVDKKSVLAHQLLLEAIMETTTIIPASFGHIVESEQHIRTHLLEAKQETLKKALADLDGKVELGLKAYFLDIGKIFKEISETNEEIRRMKRAGRVGRNQQIRAGEIAAKALEAKKAMIEEKVISFIADYVIEKKNCKLFADEMISNLAFLIERRHLKELDKKINEFYNHLGDDNIKLKYVGPLPPYNFVDLRIHINA